MANKRIQLRRDTAANWTTNNPTLASGEMGIETDTKKFKFGDGNTSWTSLDYASTGGNIPTKLSDLENDENFITIDDVETAGFAKEEDIPTKTSDLTNDSKFVDEDRISPIEEALKPDAAMKPVDKQKAVIDINKSSTKLT